MVNDLSKDGRYRVIVLGLSLYIDLLVQRFNGFIQIKTGVSRW